MWVGDCFAVLIQTWQQMLTCKHDTSAAMSESAVNSNLELKVYKEDDGYRLTVTAVWCYYKVCGQSVAAAGGGGCTV